MSKEKKVYFTFAPIPLLLIAGIMTSSAVLDRLHVSLDTSWAVFGLEFVLGPFLAVVIPFLSLVLLMAGIKLTLRSARRNEAFLSLIVATLLPGAALVISVSPIADFFSFLMANN